MSGRDRLQERILDEPILQRQMATLFEPPVFATVDPDQLAQTRPPVTRLVGVRRSRYEPGDPKPGGEPGRAVATKRSTWRMPRPDLGHPPLGRAYKLNV